MGNITESLAASRILAHGKVESLATAFSLGGSRLYGNRGFSIFLVPKEGTTDTIAIVSAKLSYDATASDMPVVVGSWNEGVFVELSASETLLDDYDVYWGTAQKEEV